MFRYDLYGKTFDCAWNGGVKWMYSSSLMRMKVLENMSQYKVKQAVKKKKTWNPRIIPGTDMTAVYLEKCVWDLWLEKIILLTQLSSEPVAMKRPHGEMAAEHGWQRFTWFSYRRVHLEERCMWNTVTYFLTAVCWSIYMYQCINGTWKQLETFYVYVYFQYNVRVHPKILEGLLFITRNKIFASWYTDIWKYLKICANFVCWI